MAMLRQDFSDIDALKNSGSLQIPQTRKEKIQAELKLLEWHKLANEAAIKGAIIQTKSLKQQTNNRSTNKPYQAEEDEKWIKKVIQQEHIKPLEVSKDFVLEFERREKENSDRLESQVNRHIHTLQNLRHKLEARHDLKQRSEEYRQWQRDFLPKKHAVMIGKTLAEIETKSGKGSPSRALTEDERIDAEMDPKLIQKHLYGDQQTTQKAKSAEELNNVLSSLHKLSELEKRISLLEQDNQYDALLSLESPSANQRTAIEFRKKRTPVKGDTLAGKMGTRGPVGMVYEVRNKPKPLATSNNINNNTNNKSANNQWRVASGGGAMAVKAKRNSNNNPEYEEGEDDYESDFVSPRGGSNKARNNVFITAQPSEDLLPLVNEREAKRKERLRLQAMAPAGVKVLKERVTAKQGRAKEQLIGRKKHEEAMKEMARRKAEARNTSNNRGAVPGARGGGKPVLALPKKGLAAGVHNKNAHLQEFQQLKKSHLKRREESIKKSIVPKEKTPLERRIQSQTAPVYNGRVLPQVLAKGATATAAKVSTTGTGMTRRTNNTQLPTRKPTVSAVPLPPIAVTGMGGLRAIRAGHR